MSDTAERTRLEHEILRDFPIARGMGVVVEHCDLTALVLCAPLEPNLNASGTAFGGSIGALAMLAGWACSHRIAERAGLEARVVIQHADVHFVRPAAGSIRATCAVPPANVVEHWLTALRHHHKGRIQLPVEIWCGDQIVAEFVGRYVGMRPEVQI